VRRFNQASIGYTFEPTAQATAFPLPRSTSSLITDIWRTGSEQSKRFGGPLAVADGDGIRRPPGRDGECEGAGHRGICRARASQANAHRLLPCSNGPVLGSPRQPVRRACRGMQRSSGVATNMTSMDRPPPRLARANP
jgi:hypothetical protein